MLKAFFIMFQILLKGCFAFSSASSSYFALRAAVASTVTAEASVEVEATLTLSFTLSVTLSLRFHFGYDSVIVGLCLGYAWVLSEFFIVFEDLSADGDYGLIAGAYGRDPMACWHAFLFHRELRKMTAIKMQNAKGKNSVCIHGRSPVPTNKLKICVPTAL